MTVTYLKFPDEATAKTVLADYLDPETGAWITDSHTHSLDPVGEIYTPTGNTLTDPDGVEYPEMALVPGWHVNFIGELPTMPSAYIINPTTPSRVFAGVTNDTPDQPSRTELNQGI